MAIKISPAKKQKLKSAFNPDLHPRYPAGHPQGGKFMPKGSADYNQAIAKGQKTLAIKNKLAKGLQEVKQRKALTSKYPKLTREGRGGAFTQESKVGVNTVKTKISRDPTQDFDPPPWLRKIDIYVNGGFDKSASIEGKEGLKLALASKEHIRQYIKSAPEGSVLTNTPFRDDGFGDQRVKLYEKAGFSSPNKDGVMFSIVSNGKNVPITLEEVKKLKFLNHIKES